MQLPRCHKPLCMHDARGCLLDDESHLLRCLDAFVEAKQKMLDIRAVKCKKCQADLIDHTFDSVLANTRVCRHCKTENTVGSNVACNPLATVARPVITNVAINATNVQKIANRVHTALAE